jgi:hypothetical protein
MAIKIKDGDGKLHSVTNQRGKNSSYYRPFYGWTRVDSWRRPYPYRAPKPLKTSTHSSHRREHYSYAKYHHHEAMPGSLKVLWWLLVGGFNGLIWCVNKCIKTEE